MLSHNNETGVPGLDDDDLMWIRAARAVVIGAVFTVTLLVALIGGPVRDGVGPTTAPVPATTP